MAFRPSARQHPCLPSSATSVSPQRPLSFPFPSVTPISAPVSAPPSPLPSQQSPLSSLAPPVLYSMASGRLCFPDCLDKFLCLQFSGDTGRCFLKELTAKQRETNPNKAAHHLRRGRLLSRPGPGLQRPAPRAWKRLSAFFPTELGLASLSQASLAPKPFLIGIPI